MRLPCHKGEIMAVKITPGNIADRAVLDAITRHLSGKLYANKGYISREVFSTLWQRGLHLCQCRLKSPQKRRLKTPHFVSVISRCCDLGSCAWEVCPDGAVVCRR